MADASSNADASPSFSYTRVQHSYVQPYPTVPESPESHVQFVINEPFYIPFHRRHTSYNLMALLLPDLQFTLQSLVMSSREHNATMSQRGRWPRLNHISNSFVFAVTMIPFSKLICPTDQSPSDFNIIPASSCCPAVQRHSSSVDRACSECVRKGHLLTLFRTLISVHISSSVPCSFPPRANTLNTR